MLFWTGQSRLSGPSDGQKELLLEEDEGDEDPEAHAPQVHRQLLVVRRRVGNPGEGKHVLADLVTHVDLRQTVFSIKLAKLIRFISHKQQQKLRLNF